MNAARETASEKPISGGALASRVALRKQPAEADSDGGDGCGVSSCGKPVARHIALGKVTAALPGEKMKASGRSIGLCKDHYRAFKKATRADRELDRAGW